MSLADFLQLALRSLVAHRLRSFLTLLGIGVGIAAVILLTSIGEGLHQFVLKEFTQFGTNIIQVTPGRQGARGGPPGLPSTTRELTLDDAAAIARLPLVTGMTPIVHGNSEVSAAGRVRRTSIYGVGAEMDRIFSMRVGIGRFLAPDEPAGARAFVVLGREAHARAVRHANRPGTARSRESNAYRARGERQSRVNREPIIHAPARVNGRRGTVP